MKVIVNAFVTKLTKNRRIKAFSPMVLYPTRYSICFHNRLSHNDAKVCFKFDNVYCNNDVFML